MSNLTRSLQNYASIYNIAKDVKSKFGYDTIGVIFPISYIYPMLFR